MMEPKSSSRRSSKSTRDNIITSITTVAIMTKPNSSSQRNSIGISQPSIDPDGDLVLSVGFETTFEPIEFRVCSSAMTRASPVWKRMLSGQWAESKPETGEWIVILPEDNPNALETVLEIVHCKLYKSMFSKSTSDLFDITVTANKYDLIHCTLLSLTSGVRM
ncbi:hypothetical protein B0H66DRAFT_399235 [Apodospora peruviana]|uniref:BTB domain-containing protein n=1 Tax=Apodospora peruviana TaxID=516989 RepID=A0AAE0HT60_9PEZI|nr:hypothetical protein B0H66DRAFT_399235 [Apodospora peruviana]